MDISRAGILGSQAPGPVVEALTTLAAGLLDALPADSGGRALEHLGLAAAAARTPT